MNGHFVAWKIKYLPQGGGQCDPPLPWAMPTTAQAGLQRWASQFRTWVAAWLKVTCDA